jgi:hypothetical protein
MINRNYASVTLIALLCMTVSLGSATLSNDAHLLSATAENAVLGGTGCSDLMDGIAVGLGVGVIFGCLWCGAGAILAKGIGLFC